MMKNDPNRKTAPRPETPAEEEAGKRLRELVEEEGKKIAERGKQGREALTAMPSALDEKTRKLLDLERMLRGGRPAAQPAKPPTSDPMAD